MLTIAQAAKLAGISRATLYRRIKDGTVTAEKIEDGSLGGRGGYRIDPSEIRRVYGDVAGPVSETFIRQTDERSDANMNRIKSHAELSDCTAEREHIKTLQNQVEWLRSQHETIIQQLGNVTRILTDQRESEIQISDPKPNKAMKKSKKGKGKNTKSKRRSKKKKGKKGRKK